MESGDLLVEKKSWQKGVRFSSTLEWCLQQYQNCSSFDRLERIELVSPALTLPTFFHIVQSKQMTINFTNPLNGQLLTQLTENMLPIHTEAQNYDNSICFGSSIAILQQKRGFACWLYFVDGWLGVDLPCSLRVVIIHMCDLQSFRKTICCVNEARFPSPYNFSFGSPESLADNRRIFESNFVKTSKYTWYDFLPKSLIEQFYRIANIYFLVIGILQSIPAISPLGPLTAWAPLIVVLGISMLREGYEDYQRYASDLKLNHECKAVVVRNGEEQTVEWSEVVVGDICKVEENDFFPADLILLASSTEGGIAFIETASLDGEKNLKPRNAYPRTQMYNTLPKIAQLRGELHGIVPDKELHVFNSTLMIGQQRVDFSQDKQLLYRGTKLMNTKWVYGLVIYTGRNSKIMMNSGSQTSKMSQIEIKVNYILAFILLLQIVLCIIVAILDSVFIRKYKDTDKYIAWSSYTAAGDAALIFCTYFVLINTMIPISLIVSLEIVKMAQSVFINKDQFMHSKLMEKGAWVRSASLNEELGQIEHIFTDKTGTLTTNRMEFKIAVIGNQIYGDIGLVRPNPNKPPQKEVGFKDDELARLMQSRTEEGNTPVRGITIKNKEKNNTIPLSNMRELAHEFLTALAITHEVVVDTDKHGKTKYQGPSPDEITLVDAARSMGYEFIRSTQSSTQFSINGNPKRLQLLQTFAFNSDRKRMSVVVQEEGVIKLYMKGADNIVKKRLADDQKLNLDAQLDEFAKIGLRTLLVGMRIISEQEYALYKQRVAELPRVNRDTAFNLLVSQLESQIYLIGATAVLDRLQDEVPETIRDLIRANIKIWMLTGDKMETAENIAKSCNLIQPHFQVLRYIWKEKEIASIQHYLANLLRKAEKWRSQNLKVSLLVEGQYITPILADELSATTFIEIAECCESVVCCRLLPSQKADVVSEVRRRLGKITLSIGDGANDVPMIKTAHIGIGLYGQEGMGAVQASDYALPQFRMLWRLLLVHGRWNYMRISEMILYFFYKNMLFTIPQFIFAFYCGFSGQTIFDDIYISLYNLVFTSLPLVVRAILEQDVYFIQPAKNVPLADQSEQRIGQHLMDTQFAEYIPSGFEVNKYLYRLFPKIYFIGQQNCIFNYRNFALWVGEAIMEAILISFFSLYILSENSVSSTGHSTDMWLVSLTIFTSVMLVATFKLSTHTKFWSFLLVLSILILSLGLYVAYMWISNYYFSDYVKGTSYLWYTSGETYFVVLFCVCAVLTLDGVVLAMDQQHSGLLSKVRKIVEEHKENIPEVYEMASVNISVNTRA